MSDAADAPWLDAQEQHAWRAYLESSIRLQAEIERGLRAQGLTHAYYEILVRLSESPNRSLRMSTLADCSVSSRSRLSHAVARLEEQGLVRREAATDDRRGQLCHLTDAGFARLAAAAPEHVRVVRSVLLDALTRDQLLALGEISRAVNDHMAADTPAG
jgi:DNA-binding MarR family transcriptional regulator